jgi:hypothetical protein
MQFSHTIQEGDTLQLIAQRVFNNASYWSEIATLNDLDYPYIIGIEERTKYLGCKVKCTGDILTLPILNKLGSFEVYNDPLEEILGSDLYLGMDMENLSMQRGGEFSTDLYADLKVATGFRCLSQDLIHRLTTPYGTLAHHPEYGSTFLSSIGDKKDSTRIYKACLELEKTFRTDPRVLEVSQLHVSDLPTGVSIDCYITTSMGKFKFSEDI